jgi:hypothetical protein
MDDNWDCEAYGSGSESFGALCFFAEQGERACISQAMCHLSMTGERQRIFGRIRELADAGDETGTYLASVFTSPDQILGGNG